MMILLFCSETDPYMTLVILLHPHPLALEMLLKVCCLPREASSFATKCVVPLKCGAHFISLVTLPPVSI